MEEAMEEKIRFRTYKEVQRFIDKMKQRKDVKGVMLRDFGNYILLTYSKIEK